MEEKTENFSFALESYIKAGFTDPDIVFTDRSKALMKAIHDQWLSRYKHMKHFLCVYHIYRNLQTNLGSKNPYLFLIYYFRKSTFKSCHRVQTKPFQSNIPHRSRII